MAVLRIVADLASSDPSGLAAFYKRLFGLETAMDFGWISTLTTLVNAPVQLSIASEGGSGTPVPTLSIEVDNLEETQARAQEMNIPIEYGPVLEPWGVRRFFLRDPAGNLLNILTHADVAAVSGETNDV